MKKEKIDKSGGNFLYILARQLMVVERRQEREAKFSNSKGLLRNLGLI